MVQILKVKTMKACRISITSTCNFKCTYCIMKNTEVLNSFKPYNIYEILTKNYDVYLLTGGEPFTTFDKLLTTTKTIKKYSPNSQIFIYTNGTGTIEQITKLKGLVDGLNIGWHLNNQLLGHFKALSSIIPIRIYSLIDHVTDNLRTFCTKNNIELKSIDYGQCNNPNEDRYKI